MKEQHRREEEFQEKILQVLFQAIYASHRFSGANLVYKKLKTQVVRKNLIVNMALEDAYKRSEDGIKKLGAFIDIPQCEKQVLAATYGSGFGNMNPAVICIEFTENGKYETTLDIAAYGKEGLINQKTASKAIEMFLTACGIS